MVSLTDTPRALVRRTLFLKGARILFGHINTRVNYTPLPSKMLEIHSPPLLC